jgi:predicted Zn-dependent protease
MKKVGFLLLSSLAVILVMLISSCATTGPGGQKDLILISTSQEISIGQEMDRQVRSSETVLADSAWQEYITEIGQRIVAVSDRSDLPFQFVVIESDQVNAFAAPGGYVYFYTGLLREMNQEAELAAVMAHEISHVVGRHGIKRMQSIMGAAVVFQLALGGQSQDIQNLAGAALGIAMSGYSRSQENEADEFGTIYMARAGWDPRGMVAMFNVLQSLHGERDLSFFEMLSSSHPAIDDRINSVSSQISAMQPLPRSLLMDSNRFQTLKKKLPPPGKETNSNN